MHLCEPWGLQDTEDAPLDPSDAAPSRVQDPMPAKSRGLPPQEQDLEPSQDAPGTPRNFAFVAALSNTVPILLVAPFVQFFAMRFGCIWDGALGEKLGIHEYTVHAS